MADDMLRFIQVAFRGFLDCLGLKNETPPSHDPATTDETAATTDPVHSSPIDNNTGITTMDDDLNNNVDSENTSSSLVTIDELINNIGNTSSVEAHYVELVTDGETNTSLLATSLISSGGGGSTH